MVKVRKFILDDGYSIGRMESWFSDLAGEGLHLSGIGRVFARFVRGEPKNTRYRIDVLDHPPTEEQLEIYKDAGWDYVTHHHDFYIFSSPAEAHCPELHTDPIEQGYTLNKLDKRLKHTLIWMSILMLVFLVMMFALLFLDRTPILSMMDSTWIQKPLLLLVELYIFYTVIRNFFAVRRLKKRLAAGKPINHRESWRKYRLLNGFVSSIFIVLAGITLCVPFIGIAKSTAYTLPPEPTDLPVLRLAQIERNPDLERRPIYHSQGVDWGNRVGYQWSLFAPVQYAVNEHGIVENLMWEDQSGKYTPSLESEYYRLTFPLLAGGLIEDLMERYVDHVDPKVTVQGLVEPQFDQLWIAENGNRKQLFAARGRVVVYISYYGHAPAHEIAANLAALVTDWDVESFPGLGID